METIRIALWNIEWRPLTSPAGRTMRAIIEEHAPDLICITEGHESFLDGSGHLITSTPDYGMLPKAGRRKVLLWSRTPWQQVDQIGDPALPPGRFVAGRTVTRLGEMNVIGVCIPWSHAHVNMGRQDRKPWDEHCSYLSGLAEVLSGRDRAAPTILLGDFNQTVPRSRAPARVYEALRSALPSEMVIATEGVIPDLGAQSIDHLVHTPDLQCARVRGLSNWTEDGSRLSDHFGLVVELEPPSTRALAPTPPPF